MFERTYKSVLHKKHQILTLLTLLTLSRGQKVEFFLCSVCPRVKFETHKTLSKVKIQSSNTENIDHHLIFDASCASTMVLCINLVRLST